MQPVPDDATIASLQCALLAFFDEHARPLPWRGTRDTYAIWISEVMSQQTRIETVLPYYERWVRRFPDVDGLAAADLDDVLKHWEGLGYYSRARHLHAAARTVRERHGGIVPTTYSELRALPGVGDYTAGAVASIAGGESRPAVDGNVRRVFARLFDLAQPAPARLHAIASALLPSERPGDFNQALMELGATICTPRAPRCEQCPVSSHCASLRNGMQLQRPLPRPRKIAPRFDVATAVLVDDAGRLLLVRRTTSLLRGLWSFPGEQLDAAGDALTAAADIARRFGAIRRDPRPLATIEHTFSHRRERYVAFLIEVASSGPVCSSDDAVWVDADMTERALPRAQQKIRALAVAVLDAARTSGG